MNMAVDLNNLIDKTPAQLSQMKKMMLDTLRFEDASTISDYINHCINTGRMVKKILAA